MCGGTILSSALAVLQARGDDSVASLTLRHHARPEPVTWAYSSTSKAFQREIEIGGERHLSGSGAGLRFPDAARQ